MFGIDHFLALSNRALVSALSKKSFSSVSCPILEHVPDIDAALSETARVSNSRGVIFTFPFASGNHQGIVRARQCVDHIEYLLPPKYHDTPMKPEGGSLVYEIPGWDIVERAKAAGYQAAYFAYISSAKYGVVGMDLNGIFVFVASKQTVDWR